MDEVSRAMLERGTLRRANTGGDADGGVEQASGAARIDFGFRAG